MEAGSMAGMRAELRKRDTRIALTSQQPGNATQPVGVPRRFPHTCVAMPRPSARIAVLSAHRPGPRAPSPAPPLQRCFPSCAPAMDLQLLEHRVRVTSIDKSAIWLYTHPLVKLILLRHRTRCKFFSLTETPEDYTLMLDEAGFEELTQSNFLNVAEHTWRVLNVLSNGIQTGGVTKIARSVIAPLAEHNVSVLMLSTYQTDFILVREDDLPVVLHTLLGELKIYKEENGDLVPISHTEEYNGVKSRNMSDLTVHPVQSPQNRFCILTLDRDTLPSISTILLDVLFYSHASQGVSSAALQDNETFPFFALSLIDGYISIVMDTETKKKFPTDLLLTSSSGELWRMVRIGGQPLGFDECGIVSQIAGPLAAADISAYYISTFNFDHALVPEEDIECVIELLHQRQEDKS